MNLEMTRNVLVVDDEDPIRQLLAIILKGAGYSVIEAVNGQDALNKLNCSDIEMVITDLSMPRMDGIEFIKELRKKPDYVSLPVIMLTSGFHEYKKAEGEQVGVNDWVRKPFLRHQLLKTVKRLMPSEAPAMEIL